MIYTATARHPAGSFTGTGKTDHEAVTAALSALRAIWSIDDHNTKLIVRQGAATVYVTTATKYFDMTS
jgi:hypothetical protein